MRIRLHYASDTQFTKPSRLRINRIPYSGRSQLVQASVEYDRTRWAFDNYTVMWINNTVAQTIGTGDIGTSAPHIMIIKATYTHFPTVDAASAYFDSLRPQYPKKNDYLSRSGGAAYYEITGKLPTVTKEVNNDKHISSDYSRILTQQDALITQRATTFYYPNPETNQA